LRAGPILLLGLAPLIPWTQARLEQRLPAHGARSMLYLSSGPQARRLADGFSDLLADVYWLRTVQYFGSQRAFGDGTFDLLGPLVDITTHLDPRLEIAYRYGAIFLAEPQPAGAGQPAEAIAVLRRGVAHLPQSWRLWQDLALFHFFFLDDAPAAAAVLLEAADRPGMPSPVFKTLAADLLAQRGDRGTARALWKRIHDEAEPGVMRDNAVAHLRQLDALDAVDALSAATRAFRGRFGRPPSSLDELRRFGVAPGALVDPAGVPFDYNPETGEVSIARRSSLWRARIRNQ
jgi:hypothetical protein